MEMQGDVWHGFVSSLLSDSQNKGGDVISSEDAAWVESCLVKDAELSDSGWDTLKDAILDIIGCEASSNKDTSDAECNDLSRQTHDDVVAMNEESGTTLILGGVDTDHDLVSEQGETAFIGETYESLTSVSAKTEAEKFRSYLRHTVSNSNDQKNDEDTGLDSEQEFTNESELLPEDIFKVWDLETPEVEEDELVQQLQKFLAGSSADVPPPLPLDNSVTDPEIESLDDLVAGMADLTLHQLSSS